MFNFVNFMQQQYQLNHKYLFSKHNKETNFPLLGMCAFVFICDKSIVLSLPYPIEELVADKSDRPVVIGHIGKGNNNHSCLHRAQPSKVRLCHKHFYSQHSRILQILSSRTISLREILYFRVLLENSLILSNFAPGRILIILAIQPEKLKISADTMRITLILAKFDPTENSTKFSRL